MHKPSLSWAAFDGFSDDELDRFLAGLSTPDELTRFQAYLAQHQVAAVWTKLFGSYEQGFASDLVTGNARARLAARLDGLSRGQRVFKERPLRRVGWYAFAGFVVGAAVIVASWKLGVRVIERGAAIESPYTTYATANGQRATITLPDGNTVALDVASRLEVPMGYSAGNHTIRLVGEALFTVSHHTGTPFTVVSGTTTARVLGTSFVLRHYLTDTVATVAVEEGKVTVGTVVVTAQHQIAIDPHGVMRIQSADPSRFAFATGVLALDVTPLSGAIPELDRWYNADIRLGDPALARQEIKGRFTAGSLADLAEILELTFDVRVVRDGRVLTLFPRTR